ncbi:hydroxyacid oxidase 1 [Trichonephila clavipes]|nr:hydroxyacid oxidase 1 [Trichonephila clavipes]
MDTTGKLQKMKTLRDFEMCSLEIMSNHAKSYFSAGACSKSTPRENEEAFHRYRIRPRVLRDVSNAKMNCKIVDSSVSCPIGIAPVGLHVLAHQEAELATVKGV